MAEDDKLRQYPAEDDKLRQYPAEDARQGFIVLRTPLRKAIFIAGLAGFVLLVAVTTCVPLP